MSVSANDAVSADAGFRLTPEHTQALNDMIDVVAYVSSLYP